MGYGVGDISTAVPLLSSADVVVSWQLHFCRHLAFSSEFSGNSFTTTTYNFGMTHSFFCCLQIAMTPWIQMEISLLLLISSSIQMMAIWLVQSSHTFVSYFKASHLDFIVTFCWCLLYRPPLLSVHCSIDISKLVYIYFISHLPVSHAWWSVLEKFQKHFCVHHWWWFMTYIHVHDLG